jgi:hypothetical protein
MKLRLVHDHGPQDTSKEDSLSSSTERVCRSVLQTPLDAAVGLQSSSEEMLEESQGAWKREKGDEPLTNWEGELVHRYPKLLRG